MHIYKTISAQPFGFSLNYVNIWRSDSGYFLERSPALLLLEYEDGHRVVTYATRVGGERRGQLVPVCVRKDYCGTYLGWAEAKLAMQELAG